jgi:iron-sulfur cluster repair protein YtfE (RIC family)
MNSARIDFYTKVHKALRASLFELSRHAAVTDYSDPHALQGLSQALDGILGRLASHARHEARFIHPLLAEKTGTCPFDTEHDALEEEQARLARLLARAGEAPAGERNARGLLFYRALNAFIARYLAHLDQEEAAMPVLWERCSDDELHAVMARFGQSRPLGEALADIGWMLPALSAPEQAELVDGMTAALARR